MLNSVINLDDFKDEVSPGIFRKLRYAIWLLTSPVEIASTLTKIPAEENKLSAYLYFRGWFLVCAITLGAYAYIKNWHTGLVLGGLTALSVVNTMFDMFTIFPDLLAKRSPFFTAILVIRVSVMLLVISLVMNRHRLPTGRDRLSLLLPFKNSSRPACLSNAVAALSCVD